MPHLFLYNQYNRNYLGRENVAFSGFLRQSLHNVKKETLT